MKRFLDRLDLIAIISLPYVLTIVWQYSSLLPNRAIAWTVAVIASLVAWYFLSSLTENAPEKLPRQFWLVVVLPLLLFFMMRVAFPDISFDVLNYHILHSERALRGPLFLPGDFFPTPAPFNPTPDILTGLYRYLLGYRFGTIANLAALIWTAAILDRLLRRHVDSLWLRSAGVLFILLTEQILFQINEYMIDLLALPLLLEATVLSLTPVDKEELWKRTSRLALFLGLATAFKLANLIVAVPLVLVYLVNLKPRGGRETLPSRFWAVAKSTPFAALLFIIPSAPFMVFIYRLTGNPVFPLYNGLFKSPYWPKGVVFDPRWGPFGFVETVIWPVLMYFRPERLSEFPSYSGRLSLGYPVSVVCLIFARGNRQIRAIAFITLVATILWSATSGYIRYALYLELTSGILLVWLTQKIWQRNSLPRPVRLLAATLICLVLLIQSSFAMRYAYRWEWSGRATVVSNGDEFLRESRDSFRDRSLWSYVPMGKAQLFDPVDVWLETTYKTSAMQALLKPQTPVIGVRNYNYFTTKEARRKFAGAMQLAQGKRMYTLTNSDGLEEARAALAARGLMMGKTEPVAINYFSKTVTIDLLLVEVLPNWQNNSGKAQTGLPLPDMAFLARLSAANTPAVMRAGQQYTLRVTLRNDSPVIWPGQQPQWKFQLTVANRWLTPEDAVVNDVDGRVALVHDLKPSETVELLLKVTAPSAAGNYVLQLDMVQEGVAWFGERGSDVLNLKIKVE